MEDRAMASSNLLHLAQSESPDDANELARRDGATPRATDDPINLPDPVHEILNVHKKIRLQLPNNSPSVVSQTASLSQSGDSSPRVNAVDPPNNLVLTRVMLEYDRFMKRLGEYIQSSQPRTPRKSSKREPHSSNDLHQETKQIGSPIHPLFALPADAFPAPNIYKVMTIYDRTYLHQPSHWSTEAVPSEPASQSRVKVDHAFDDIPDYHFIPQSLSSQLPQQQLQGLPMTELLTLQQILTKLEGMSRFAAVVPSAELALLSLDVTDDVGGASKQDVKSSEKCAQTDETKHGTTFVVPDSESDEEEYFTGSEGDEGESEAAVMPLRASDRPDEEGPEQYKDVPAECKVAHDSPT